MRKTFTHLLVGACLAATACGAGAPNVKMIEISQSKRLQTNDHTTENGRTVRVFLEVHNPTGSSLSLSRLRYRFSVDTQLAVSGEIWLKRAVSAHSAAVIDVPLWLTERQLGALQHSPQVTTNPDGSITCALDGRLFATANHTAHAWDIQTSGTMRGEPTGLTRGAAEARVHMATSAAMSHTVSR